MAARPLPSRPAPPTPASRSWWGDLGVRTKVLAAVSVAALAALVVGVVGLNALGSSAERTEYMHDRNVVGVQLTEEMRFQLMNIRFASTSRSYANTPELRQTYTDLREQARTDLTAAAEAYKQLPDVTADEAAAVDELLDALRQYFDHGLQMDAFVAAGQMEQFNALRKNTIAPLTEQMVADLEGLTAMTATDAQADAVAAQDHYESTRTSLYAVLVVGLAAALGIGFLVARGVTRPLDRLRRSAERLAEGDLTQPTGVTQRDEVGRTAAALDTAVDSMREVLAAVAASADAVAASSEELSASSAQISASAEETSAQSGVVAGAAEEVSRNVQTVAAGAEQMGASIREIATNAAEASQVASRAVSAAETTTATVAKLGESS
ncbi:MCP four helix bundle domain-containing protein, partial [Geodermatophilus sp. SYSU D00079]